MRASGVLKGRVMQFIFWALVMALTVGASRIHQPTLKAAVPSTGIVPYTVVLQDFAVEPNGTTVPTFKLTVAVRSDGSRAMESISSDPASPFSETILDFASGEKIYILRHLGLKSTTFDPAKGVPSHWLPDPRNKCLYSGSSLHEEFLGEEVVNGYRTAKITDGPTTRWLALDCACALIKDRAEWPDGQASEKRLVALIPGEPTASMFDDLAGLQEVPPSRWLSPASPSAQDAYYESHRPSDASPRAQ